MTQVAITQDGKKVISGIGKIYFQEGLPLSIIFDKLQENNSIPSWIHLYEELKDNGMNHERVIHLLNEHVFESYGKEFRDIVIKRLNDRYK